MRLIDFLIGVVGLGTVVFIGAAWTILMMTPTGILIGIAVFFIVRANQREVALRVGLAEEAVRQKLLNDQEYGLAKHPSKMHAVRTISVNGCSENSTERNKYDQNFLYTFVTFA